MKIIADIFYYLGFLFLLNDVRQILTNHLRMDRLIRYTGEAMKHVDNAFQQGMTAAQQGDTLPAFNRFMKKEFNWKEDLLGWFIKGWTLAGIIFSDQRLLFVLMVIMTIVMTLLLVKAPQRKQKIFFLYSHNLISIFIVSLILYNYFLK